MRIKTLRSLAISLTLLLLPLPIGLYAAIPRYVGLVFIFVCSILLAEYTPRFGRGAALSLLLTFIYTTQITGLATAGWLLTLLDMLYQVVLVLLVLFLCDAIADVCKHTENLDVVGMCDRNGYIFALHFLLYEAQFALPDMKNILYFIDILLILFCIVMFFVFYRLVHTQVDVEELQGAEVDLDEYEAALQEAAEQAEDEAEE